MNKSENPMSRGEFFRFCGRGAVAVAAGTVLGVLGLQGRISVRASNSCINNSVCRGCRRFAQCILPTAKSARLKIGQGQGENERE